MPSDAARVLRSSTGLFRAVRVIEDENLVTSWRPLHDAAYDARATHPDLLKTFSREGGVIVLRDIVYSRWVTSGNLQPAPESYAQVAELAGFALASFVQLAFDRKPLVPLVVLEGQDGVAVERFGSEAEGTTFLTRNPARATRAVLCFNETKAGATNFLASCLDYGPPRVEFKLALPYRTGPTQSDFSVDPLELLDCSNDDVVRVISRPIGLGARGCPRGAELWDQYGPKDETPATGSHENQWNTLVATAMAELQAKQGVLPPADPTGRWGANQDDGTFFMADARGSATVRARFQAVGTYSMASKSWLWAWANASIDAANRQRLEQVRVFGRRHYFFQLVHDRVPCTAYQAEELWAVAVHLIQAPAWYRLQATPTSVLYLALFDLEFPIGAA